MQDVSPPPKQNEVTPAVIPEQAGMVRYLAPAAALAYRAPLAPDAARAGARAAGRVTRVGVGVTVGGR